MQTHVMEPPRAPLFSAKSKYRAHRAPVPAPIEEPVPGHAPVPNNDPVPHQDPTIIDDPIPHQDPAQVPNGEPTPVQLNMR